MVCDLDKTAGSTCILRSPLISDNLSWNCMYVQYELSSYDVKLTLELHAGDKPILSHILLANETAKWMPNPGVGSAISLQFTASRYLVSTEDYEYALVSGVDFLPCPPKIGKSNVCICLNSIDLRFAFFCLLSICGYRISYY